MIVTLFEYGVPLRHYNVTMNRESFKTIPTALYIGFDSGRTFAENRLDLRMVAGKANIFEQDNCIMADVALIKSVPAGSMLDMMWDTVKIRPSIFGIISNENILSCATINYLYASSMSEDERKLKMIGDAIEGLT